jgi:hypothetical protein
VTLPELNIALLASSVKPAAQFDAVIAFRDVLLQQH